MPAKLSLYFRSNPSQTATLIRTYEQKIRGLFLRWRARSVLALEKSARTLAAPELSLGTLESALREGAEEEVLVPAKPIVVAQVDDALKAGTTFADTASARIGLQGALVAGVDWQTLDALRVRNLSVLRGLTEDETKAIIQQISEGLTYGEGMPQLARRLRDTIDGMTKIRARTIARTETMMAFNTGTITRYGQYGVKKVQYLAGIDGRECGDCRDDDGRIFPIEEAPVLPRHPNCRCTYAPIQDEKKDAVVPIPKETLPGEMTPQQVLEKTLAIDLAERKKWAAISNKIGDLKFKLHDNNRRQIDLYRQIAKLSSGDPSIAILERKIKQLADEAKPMIRECDDLLKQEKTLEAALIKRIREEALFTGKPISLTVVGPKGWKDRAGTIQEATDFVRNVCSSKTYDGATVTVKAIRGRASCSWGGMTINIARGDQTWVYVHEIGHSIEMRDPEVLQKALAFYDRRTAGESLQSLRKLTGNSGYKASETARPDKFLYAYMGKEYNRKATELVSMGIQKLYEDPIKLAKDDPDYFQFIIGALRGV